MTSTRTAEANFLAAADKLPTLWALSEEFSGLIALFESPDANPEAIEAELARVVGDIRRKGAGVAVVIGALEGLAAFQRANADRLAAKARANQSHAERLRSYALDCLKQLGLVQLETGTHTLTVRQNPPEVTVLNEQSVPPEFVIVETTYKVDKRGILSHYKQSGEIPSGTEITRGERLEVR